MIRISVNGLICKYGSAAALDGVSFEIARGDFTGIVGPNGSGKSTLLRAMSRVLKPSGGGVLLDGLDVFSQDPGSVARRVAVVGQDGPTEFAFTVLDVVLMGRLPHLRRFERESPADIELARDCLRLTGIHTLENRRITEVSAGERQRALIARALVQQPEILLMDEPTSFLDIGYQVDVMELISRLNREQGLSVIVVLHDLNLAAQYCKSVILMKAGRVQSSGTPEEVITAPAIRAAYGSEVLVVRHPVHGSPHVIILPKRRAPVRSQEGKGRLRVHIIGGGGMSSRLMDMISARGFGLSVGVLNAGDGDWEKARLLGATVVDVPPFSPLTKSDLERNIAAIQGALAVVLADIPFGPGNLKNLEAAVAAAFVGIPLVVVEGAGLEARDYTGGGVAPLLKRLKEMPASAPESTLLWCRDDGEAVDAVEGLYRRSHGEEGRRGEGLV